MIENNYFKDKALSVDKIRHFPFKTFNEFKDNVANQSVAGISVPMDYARNWVTQSSDSPRFWHNTYLALMAYVFCLPVFYILFGIFTLDISAIMYVVVAIIVAFTGSPFAMKVFKAQYLVIGFYLIVWLVSGSFPRTIYWLPVLFQYFAFNQLYKGSAGIVRGLMVENEKILCLFWKWNDAAIVLKDGTEYSQRAVTKNGKYEINEDIQKEWEEYYKFISENKNKQVNEASTKETNSVAEEKCSNCGLKKINGAVFCTNCGQKYI